ncbi:MAG: tetratricopeptide repeat protein [Pseudanabaenaceae cyanobacterium]
MTLHAIEPGQRLGTLDRATAIAQAEAVVNSLHPATDPLPLVRSLAQLALLLMETGQLALQQRAKTLLLRAEALLSHPPRSQARAYRAEVAWLMYGRGLLYVWQRSFVDALVHLRAAGRAFGDNVQGLSMVDDALGRYYAALNDFHAALFHFERSLARRSPNDPDRLISLVLLGHLHQQSYLHDRAEVYYQQALALAEDLGEIDLKLQVWAGLGRVAAARRNWEWARQCTRTALAGRTSPYELQQAAYLYLNLAEIELGEGNCDRAQTLVEGDVAPRFEALTSVVGWAHVNRMMGCILTQRLAQQTDWDPQLAETAEDYFLDASMTFEEQGLVAPYALTLHDMAELYRLTAQRQNVPGDTGKAIRALGLGLSVLEKAPQKATSLSFKLEVLLNAIDPVLWLNRKRERLRAGTGSGEGIAMVAQEQEVTLLGVEVIPDAALTSLTTHPPYTVFKTIDLLLHQALEIGRHRGGFLVEASSRRLLWVFWKQSPESQRLSANYHHLGTLAPPTPLPARRLQVPAVQAALAATDLLEAYTALPTDTLGLLPLPRVALTTGKVLLGPLPGELGLPLGVLSPLVSRTWQAMGEPNQVVLDEATCRQLKQNLSQPSFRVALLTKDRPQPQFSLEFLDCEGANKGKPAWLLEAEFPTLIRVRLPVVPHSVLTANADVGHSCLAVIAGRLGCPPDSYGQVLTVFDRVYTDLKALAVSQPLNLLLLVEEDRLEVAIALEGLDSATVDVLKQGVQTVTVTTANMGYHLESTPSSLTLRLTQSY